MVGCERHLSGEIMVQESTVGQLECIVLCAVFFWETICPTINLEINLTLMFLVGVDSFSRIIHFVTLYFLGMLKKNVFEVHLWVRV